MWLFLTVLLRHIRVNILETKRPTENGERFLNQEGPHYIFLTACVARGVPFATAPRLLYVCSSWI